MRYPSVTEVISPWTDFGSVDPDTLENAADRGRRVHALCAEYARGGFPLITMSEDGGYFQSFCRWLDERVAEVISVEQGFQHGRHGFQGHPDLICRIVGDRETLTAVDLKTPITKHRAWELQLAGYYGLAREHDFNVLRALSLRLKRDGSRALVDEVPNPDMVYRTFLEALNVWKYFNL